MGKKSRGRGKRSASSGPRYNTLEVSIVGSGLAKYASPTIYDVRPGRFLYLKPEGSDREILVKFRTWSSARTNQRIVSARPAGRREVLNTLKNMVRGFLWEKGVNVKVVEVRLDMEAGHLEVLYAADTKLDLRSYGAELARLLHLKIRFQQIGARDMARRLGGIGLCGRELCCTTFLKDLPSVTLDMARAQYLFSAPEKLSGICGRLLCCLRFELPYYREVAKVLPRLGQTLETEKGQARVVEVNALKLYYVLRYPDGTTEKVFVGEAEPATSSETPGGRAP